MEEKAYNKSVVFLIDDDTDDQEIFSLAIGKASDNVTCVFANDGIDALETLRKDEEFIPDFIFIDMNMPRMNGTQCLAEIKKLERLRHVPIYMYSTSADPVSIEDNKSLGATDFIVKPSSISELTRLLKDVLQKQLLVVLTLAVCLGISTSEVSAQTEQTPVVELKRLSVEELMNIVVTSVSRTPEKLSEVASAIQVVTGRDIERSAATRLPEALRLASNLQIAQSGAHDWGISARGFNGAPVASSSLADKLLVMIDGRTVYTPLFGGVFWDVQNVMLTDIDRIEVVSGPGGTLWGSNAVNGVINVISKNARETQGLHIAGSYGSLLNDHIELRYGSQIDSALYFRVYGQRYDYDNTLLEDGSDARDDWHMTQGGFRMDYMPSAKNSFTLQGELYEGREDDTLSTILNGQHLLGRWTHSFSERSNLSVQSYFDRTFRNIRSSPFIDELTTIDLELQHLFGIGKSHNILWGAGFRNQVDETVGDGTQFDPANRTLEMLSAFIQDQITLIPEIFQITIGSKFSENEYTGLEIQPSLRLAWTPDNAHTIWSAVSRAVRTPSRFDADLVNFSHDDFPEFVSEIVVAYELGYRVQPFQQFSFSFATFYNDYDDLRSFNITGDPARPVVFGNDLAATSWGVELSTNFLLADWWRLRGGFTYLNKEFEIESEVVYPGTELIEGIDPASQILLQSNMDIGRRWKLDLIGRYTDELPAVEVTQLPSVPSYFALNARIAYEWNQFTFILAGQNLLEKENREFGRRMIPRNVYAKIMFQL